MSYLDKIKKKVKQGVYLEKNTRNSFNIAVQDQGLLYSCRVKVDEIYNLENELIYEIEEHTDQNSNYHTLDIYNHKTKQQVI
ncbi:MAG: hypothetical protein AB8B78_12050 [Polaribacter sp.]